MYPSQQDSENWPTNCPYKSQNVQAGLSYQGFPAMQQNVPTGYPLPQPGYFPNLNIFPPQPNFYYASSGYQPTLPPPEQHVADVYDDKTINVKGFAFSDASIRRNFLRKVYGLLSVSKPNLMNTLNKRLIHIYIHFRYNSL